MHGQKKILSLSPRSKKHPLYEYLFNLIDELDIRDYECYYFYACPWGSGTDCSELLEMHFYAENVILYAEDNLVGITPHSWYTDKRPYGLQQIEKVCERFPDKKFILVNIQYELQKLVTVNNLRCVGLLPIGQVDQRSRSKVQPCLSKQSVDDRAWISFNHSPSDSRICTLSYLLFKNLDKAGNLIVSDRIINLCQPYENLDEFVTYTLDTRTKKRLKKGFQRLKNRDFTSVEILPYDEEKKVEDFSNYRITYKAYKKTRLEIVTSSLYSEPTPQVSEKEIQSIYGCNFIIIIGNPYLIKLMRKWGFDMFDDIVNHSYDSVLNPSLRLFQAIDDNLHLLDGTSDLDALWQQNKHRFSANCQLADNLHQIIERDFVSEFQLALLDLGIPHRYRA